MKREGRENHMKNEFVVERESSDEKIFGAASWYGGAIGGGG